jgi:hypothetical protein
MTQDEYKCLLVRVFDEINHIKWYQHYLNIALEQLDNPTDVTPDRVELLLSTYLQQIEPHFDNLDWFAEQRESSCDSLLTEE